MLLDVDISPQPYVFEDLVIGSEANNNEITENINENGLTIRQRTPLQEFYAEQNVFITGGTGFLGKILIEKLLRCCPEISRLYLLVRPKKEKGIESRMEEMFKDPIYQRLNEEMPKFLHKVVAVAGDCCVQGLGLSPADRQRLINDVSIVFHVAATVRFDEKLKLAAAINIQSTADMIDLCKDMRKLKSFIHVSTAYANCHMSHIDEKFYQYPVTHDNVLQIVNRLPESTIDEITPSILGNWPNTYAFTKAIAESLIKARSKGLPMGIFRPGIVVSTAKEPMPGWIDNLYGPTGVATGVATGVLRTLHCDPSINANIVPVDLTVNALIASAWDVAVQTSKRENDMLIYNYVSSTEAPITWGEYCDVNVRYAHDYPLSQTMWYLSFRMNKHKTLNLLAILFYHLLPAVGMDIFMRCVGQKPRFWKMYQKISKFANVISYFCTREWVFTNRNVQGLWKRMDPRDRKIFYCSMDKFDWGLYFVEYLKGIRVYLIKDDLSNLEISKKRWARLWFAHQVLKTLLFTAIIWFLWSTISTLFL